ncbi:PREDICTED: ABC transporter F family member 4-like [Camelina sativa]|uniref:ABC transporter F family member 4-like n=1 Tax=Camelina sativa TaxID=90675 RepID=A0ABM1QL19_CAMSA|nr:PREDICTED: ABC transporter F family member 4-like [Camelina sativa]
MEEGSSSQEVVGDETSSLDVVVSANEELVKLRKEAAALEALKSSSNCDDDDTGRVKLTELYDKLQELGSDDAEAQASKILAGLGFTEDEPINYLDLRAVLWLEERLCRWKNTLIVVSHDVDFLINTVKAAKRSGNRAQQDKVKERAKFAAGKEASSKLKEKDEVLF